MPFVAPVWADPGLDAVRTNMVNTIIAASASRTDPRVINALNNLRNDALNRRNTCQPNGSWTDINYNQAPSGNWSVASHYSRIYVMARAYKTPGQSLYQDQSLKNTIERALNYGAIRIYAGCPTPGNWWYWEVELPYYSLGPTLVLMKGTLSQAVYSSQAATLNYLVSLNIRQSPYTGENLIWKAMSRLYAGIVTDNVQLGQRARNEIGSACDFMGPNDDGIMPDYSFHQHSARLMTGSYGADFGKSVGDYVLYTQDTPYALTTNRFENFVNYVAEGIRWAIYHHYFDPSVMAREVTRPGARAGKGLDALAMVGNFDNLRRDECIAAAKKILETYSSSFGVAMAGMISNVLNSAIPPAMPAGHKHYWRSDYTVLRTPDMFLSIKMLSTRMISAELINGEGKKHWHASDGYMYLVRAGNEYFRNNVWPTINWERLPGTSVERRTRAPGEGYARGTRTFVGGVTTGDQGVSAMDFRPNASNLSGRKSWFFFGDEIVFLGSHLTCPSANRVETIVNQWPLSVGNAAFTVDGSQQPTTMPWETTFNSASWMHLDGIGYVFPGGQQIKARREMRSGRWSDLGTGSSTLYQNPILTIWYDHGTNPSNRTYRYIILPNRNSAETAQYAAANPVEILSGQGNIHAVKHHGLNTVGVVFWSAGTIDYLQSQDPCLVYYERTDNTVTLAVSDPAHRGQPIRLAFFEPLAPVSLPPEMSATVQEQITYITVQPQEGQSYVGVFNIPAVPPARPENMRLVNVDVDQFTAEWDASAGATGYQLQIARDAGFSQDVQTFDPGNAITYLVTGLLPNTLYFARVLAFNNAGNSPYSDVVSERTLPIPPPPQPQNVRAVNPDLDRMTIEWEASTGALGYELEVARDPDFTQELQTFNLGDVTAHLVTGLLPDTLYFIRVRAFNEGGYSSYSDVISERTLPIPPPAAPTNLHVINPDVDRMTAVWDPSPGADGYQLFIARDPEFTQEPQVFQLESVTSYLITGLLPDTLYFLIIRALNAGGYSPLSDIVSGRTLQNPPPLPPIPRNIRWVDVGVDRMTAEWDPSLGATAYELQVALNAGFDQGLRTFNLGTVTRVPVNGLLSDTLYFARVRALNSSGASLYSDVALERTLRAPPPPPPVPQALTLLPGLDRLTARWTASPGATNYELQIARDAGFALNLMTFNLGSAVSHLITGLASDTLYFARVRASNPSGASPYSNVASERTLRVPEPTPTPGPTPVPTPTPPPPPPAQASDVFEIMPTVVVSDQPVEIRSSGKVTVFRVYSVRQQKVVLEKLLNGVDHFLWDTTDNNGLKLPSNYYLAEIETEEGRVANRKMVIVR